MDLKPVLLAILLLSSSGLALSRGDLAGTAGDFSDFLWSAKHAISEWIDNANRNTANFTIGQLITVIPFVLVIVFLVTNFVAKPFLATLGLAAIFLIWFVILPFFGI